MNENKSNDKRIEELKKLEEKKEIKDFFEKYDKTMQGLKDR